MKAFVTGGTGLLGSHLTDLLLREGHTAKVLVRSAEAAARLPKDAQLSLVRGDLTEIQGFEDELTGCDVLFHCAAYFREYSDGGDHSLALQRVNVESTTRLIASAYARQVRNVVFVSSNGATGAPRAGETQTEDCGYDDLTDNLYFKSKIDAERAIDAHLAQHQDLRIVVIRPALMIGPNDNGPTPAGRVISTLLAGRMPFLLPGNIVLVDARDVARATLAAATQGVSGDRFIIGGQAYTLRELAEALQSASGVRMPRLRPSYPIAMAVLALASMVSSVSGRSVPVRPRDLRRMRGLQAPDSSKARQCLGIEFRSLRDSVKDIVAWHRLNGALQSSNQAADQRGISP